MSKSIDYLGETLDGKYRLERLLGRGGMGAVYLATHLGTERFVALKLISPQFMTKDEFIERFRREARAAGRLRHPNVVDVTDFGFAQAADGARVAYLVMEYLDGCTLADVLEEEKRLSLDWVIDIIEQVCSAVDEAHAQGIVHRDLKPDNIWLEPNRLGGYRVKVLDFGIAKLGDPSSLQFVENGASTTGSDLSHETASSAGARVNEKTRRVPSDTFLGEADSAATRLLKLSMVDEESGTLLLAPQMPNTKQAATVPPAPDPSILEAAKTRVLPKDVAAGEHEGVGEEAGTRILDAPTTAPAKISTAQATADTDSFKDNLTGEVTRVGAIIGTPLYMSPEQCRGEPLDARSDIYSLGVIAYQMLAGEPPYTGDLTAVLKQHKSSAPPALREKNKKIPRRVARVIETALSKDRAARPSTATAFASELRASAEGLGVLLRRALALYGEHFTTFVRMSFLANLPAMLIIALQFANSRMASLLPKWTSIALAVVLNLALFVLNFLSVSVIAGMTVLIVAQLTVAPLRPIRLGELYQVLKKRLRAFMTTGMLASALSLFGFILFIVPGLIAFVYYTMYAPVVMLENLKNRAALRRSAQLVRRARLSVALMVLIELALSTLAQMIFVKLFSGWMTSGRGGEIQVSVGLTLYAEANSRELWGELVNIFVVPMISILTALFYFKLRQLGGEPMKTIAENLDCTDAPLNDWQRRMRARLTHISNYPR